MRQGLVKIVIAFVAVLLMLGAVSAYTGLGNQCTGCGGCPGCVKQAREHKNRDLAFSFINPYQKVDNKVDYY
jgi:hypothetical protein